MRLHAVEVSAVGHSTGGANILQRRAASRNVDGLTVSARSGLSVYDLQALRRRWITRNPALVKLNWVYSVEKLRFHAGAKNLGRYGVIRLRSIEGLPLESTHLTWIVSAWLDENLSAIVALDAL